MEVFDVARTGHQRSHDNGWRKRTPYFAIVSSAHNMENIGIIPGFGTQAIRMLFCTRSTCCMAQNAFSLHVASTKQSYLPCNKRRCAINHVCRRCNTYFPTIAETTINFSRAVMQGLEHTCRSMNTQYFHISQLWRLLVLLRLTL